MTVLPDAAPTNWVDRFAPAGLRPWLKLGRFDRPAGIWLLLLPGWQGVALAAAEDGGFPDWRLLLLFLVGATVMRAAGCAYNDIVDRDIDAQVARTAERPIASRRISVRAAWVYIAALCLIGLAVLVQLDPVAILLGVSSLGLVAAYPFMKRITWWPQAWLGLTFNWGALVGYAALDGVLAAPALLLYASGVFWTLGYDTIYALQDIEDDALVGVKSSARRLGERVREGLMIFFVLAAALALAAGITAGLGPLFYLGWIPFAAHLLHQAATVRPGDPQHALRLFKSNRDAGLILLAAIVLGCLHFDLQFIDR
jgi:4-hydroxybenzoate polyprenyltransferase